MCVSMYFETYSRTWKTTGNVGEAFLQISKLKHFEKIIASYFPVSEKKKKNTPNPLRVMLKIQ